MLRRSLGLPTEALALPETQKLDRLDEAFIYAQAIDLTGYERQRDSLREELTLAQIDHHADSIDELDVEGRRRSRSTVDWRSVITLLLSSSSKARTISRSLQRAI